MREQRTSPEGFDEDGYPVLTAEERRAINTLKRLARRWPDSLYLYSAAGSLCVMRKEPDGSHGELRGGGIDVRYQLDSIDIENTGGDW